MIVSIGIDIIEVARIREVLLRTPRFGERVFTPASALIAKPRRGGRATLCRALRGKRSALKALQTGWRGGISWQDVEIARTILARRI
jgi:holo-[acyl-carrier protein] synthase